MSENAVKNAVRDLITANKALLVTDLTSQGQPRTINQVTISSLTPPTGYFFIAVAVTSVRHTIRAGFSKTTAVPPSQAVYTVDIEISDYILLDTTDDQPFEQATLNFGLFTDRLVALLRKTYWITDSATGSKFRLSEDRTVNKNNVDVTWEEAAQFHSLLGCRLSFQLLEECTDDTILYPEP